MDTKLTLTITGDHSGAMSAIKQTTNSLDVMGKKADAANAQGKTASAAFADSIKSLGFSVANFANNPLGSMQAGVSGILAKLGPMAIGVGAIGTVAVTAAVGIYKFAAEAADAAEQLQNAAYSTGMAVREIQAFNRLGQNSGIGDLTGLVEKLNIQLGSEAGGDFVDAIMRMNIAMTAGKGVPEYLEEMRVKYAALSPEINKAEQGAADFGRRLWHEVAPLVMNSANSITGSLKEITDTGAVMSDRQVATLKEWDDAIDRNKDKLEGWKNAFKEWALEVAQVGLPRTPWGWADYLNANPGEWEGSGGRGWSASVGRMKPTGETQEERMANVVARANAIVAGTKNELIDLTIKQIGLEKEYAKEIAVKNPLKFDEAKINSLSNQIAGIKEQLKVATELGDAFNESYFDIFNGLNNMPKAMDLNIKQTLENLGNQADYLLSEQLDKANKETLAIAINTNQIADSWKELGDAAVSATEMDVALLSGVIDLHEKQYTEMIDSTRRGAESVFDAMVSRGKDAFSNIGDWIEGVFLTRLKKLFSNFIVGIMDGFKNGLGGILQGVIPGASGSGGFSFAGLGGLLSGIAPMAVGSLALGGITSGNAYGMAGGIAGAGLLGLSAAPALGMTSLAPLVASLSLPIIGGVIAAALGGVGLAKLAQGPNTYEAASKEVSRDFGGVKISDDQYKAFMDAVGITEGQGWGSRAQMNRSPEFLINYLLPLAKQQGKLDELMASFDKNGSTGAGQGSWGGISFREAMEIGNATGDWSKLNEIWTTTEGLADQLNDAISGMGDKLGVAGEAVLDLEEQMVQDFKGMQDAIEATITPIQTMYDKFLATGEITDEFAAKIRELGGDLEKFQKISDMSLEMTGLQNSLSFITSLRSAIAGLAPELDPINQILSGQMGAEAIKALADAGLDPSKISGLSGLIGMRSGMEGAQPFGKLTDGLRQALTQYGGIEGKLAVERYGQGFNTITSDLLESTRSAMNQAYLDSIKEAMGYLETAQQNTVDKMDALIASMDSAKQGIVAELDKILVAIIAGNGGYSGSGSSAGPATAQGTAEDITKQIMDWLMNRQTIPGLASGGYVQKTGLAVVHEGETYSGVGKGSGTTINIQGDIYGWDDFVGKVRQAGMQLSARGAY